MQQPISHVVTWLQPDALCDVTYLKIAYSDGVTLTCVFIIIPPIVKILPVSANENKQPRGVRACNVTLHTTNSSKWSYIYIGFAVLININIYIDICILRSVVLTVGKLGSDMATKMEFCASMASREILCTL